MDLLLPFVNSKWNNIEIRYALRSFEKHLSNIGKVWVVGDDPGLKVEWIPWARETAVGFKDRNIFEKVWWACHDDRVSSPFLYVNDDHFLSADVPGDFPNYYGTWPVKTDIYKHTIENTKAILPDAKFWDVHCPIVIEKQRFIERMKGVDWNKPGGYCMKTLYADGLEGIEYRDMKIRLIESIDTLRQMANSGAWWSVCDQARSEELLYVLKELYPKPSIYE